MTRRRADGLRGAAPGLDSTAPDVRAPVSQVESAVRGVVSAAVAAAGFDLEECRVRLGGGRRKITVVVDRDGGVELDVVAELSRAIASELDTRYDDVTGDAPYELEVTSRGVGAPMTLPRHFRRAVGRLARVTFADGRTQVVRIAHASDSGLVMLTGKAGTTPLVVPMDDVATAVIEVEFAAVNAEVRAALAAAQGMAREAHASGTEGDGAA